MYGCLKVSLCIYLTFGFRDAFWLFTVDVAFFTLENLATLIEIFPTHCCRLLPNCWSQEGLQMMGKPMLPKYS